MIPTNLMPSLTKWLLKDVAVFRGFMHSETPFFHSLWSLKEVAVNGGFNF